ncbi:hypothetical protein HDV02_001256 [Globomyces sp. JEL0801]|nr:hypothetical protein HDV02_001256 [Globomyces sp. JEL0801]
MINLITPQLQVWENSDLCKVIVLSSSPSSPAFCAGGDVKDIVLTARSQSNEDIETAFKFFEEEYKLNHLLATTKKPFVSILNGITMGGGVGISVHGQFRIVTEKTLIAMPETSIGLFPDVGGSFFLPRLDGIVLSFHGLYLGELGVFLGLTGHRLKGEEAFFAGFGTHYVPSTRIDTLTNRLAELETDELDVINGIIDEFSGDISVEKFKNWSLGGAIGDMINRCFQYNTIEEILAALEEEVNGSDLTVSAFAAKQLKVLKSVSPTSLKVTLAQLRNGAQMDIAACLQMEANMVQQFLRTPDFFEGVTAKLINKSKDQPKWNPSFENINDIGPNEVQKYFQNSAEKKVLKFYNNLTYFDYPHRTLSGLPTDRDIKQIITGDGKRDGTAGKPKTKQDLLNFVKDSWGQYDSGIIGHSKESLPKRVNIGGQFGRGKIGLVEKVTTILDRHVQESGNQLKWIH